jgi:hypothetical protein
MKRQAKFKVMGLFDGATRATVLIDRVSLMVEVRPLRRHKTYTLPLSEVAEHILWRVARAEAAEKDKEKKAKSPRKFKIKRGIVFK